MKTTQESQAEFAKLVIWTLIIVYLLIFVFGCGSFSLSPRTNSIFALQFSDQAPRALIDMNCEGRRHVFEGVAVCEQKTTTSPEVFVKILPTPGRVVFSDGISKKPIDFNFRTGGWFWKESIIDTTWVPIDIGELNSIFGDVPVAFDVQGQTDSGIINNRGLIYTRVCNDKDVPCSKLSVEFDCSGKRSAIAAGQIGQCARLSGAAQSFSIPLSAGGYNLLQGAKIRVYSPRDGWSFIHDVSAEDVVAGEVKFTYPSVLNGPDLFSLTVFQWENKALIERHAYVLVVGFSPNWTGVDRPHHSSKWSGRLEFCIPFLADLMEVQGGHDLRIIKKDCSAWDASDGGQICAFAYDRESGDQTYSCVKDGKDVRFP